MRLRARSQRGFETRTDLVDDRFRRQVVSGSVDEEDLPWLRLCAPRRVESDEVPPCVDRPYRQDAYTSGRRFQPLGDAQCHLATGEERLCVAGRNDVELAVVVELPDRVERPTCRRLPQSQRALEPKPPFAQPQQELFRGPLVDAFRGSTRVELRIEISAGYQLLAQPLMFLRVEMLGAELGEHRQQRTMRGHACERMPLEPFPRVEQARRDSTRQLGGTARREARLGLLRQIELVGRIADRVLPFRRILEARQDVADPDEPLLTVGC